MMTELWSFALRTSWSSVYVPKCMGFAAWSFHLGGKDADCVVDALTGTYQFSPCWHLVRCEGSEVRALLQTATSGFGGFFLFV
jgi:hypothetical protein